MALLTYLDASGTRKTSVLSVAGYVARDDQWVAFDDQWSKVLRTENVSGLHMKDFTAFQRDFAGWKWLGELCKKFGVCRRRS